MAQITNHQSPISNRTATQFLMPMFREWVPKGIQPWIYILQVLCIQFSCGVYLGAMEAVRGTTALQLEDLLMLLYAGLAGMAVWFPMLFRMKFRFTNQQLLITSAVHGGVVSDVVSDEVPFHEPTIAHHIGGRDCGVQFYYDAHDEHGCSAAGLFSCGRGEDTRHV